MKQDVSGAAEKLKQIRERAEHCYCVCHSPNSSRPSCVHCKPEHFIDKVDGYCGLDATSAFLLSEVKRLRDSHAQGPGADQDMSRGEARMLAMGLIDYAEGRVKSLDDIESEAGMSTIEETNRPQKGEKVRIVKVNMNCFKMYLFGHFIGSMSSEHLARAREKSIADSINRYIHNEVKERLAEAGRADARGVLESEKHRHTPHIQEHVPVWSPDHDCTFMDPDTKEICGLKRGGFYKEAEEVDEIHQILTDAGIPNTEPDVMGGKVFLALETRVKLLAERRGNARGVLEKADKLVSLAHDALWREDATIEGERSGIEGTIQSTIWKLHELIRPELAESALFQPQRKWDAYMREHGREEYELQDQAEPQSAEKPKEKP